MSNFDKSMDLVRANSIAVLIDDRGETMSYFLPTSSSVEAPVLPPEIGIPG